MDEEALSAVAGLLSGTTGPKIRSTACSTLAACTAGDAGAATRHLIGTSTHGETIVRRLLTLSSDGRIARLALTALVNVSEDEEAASVLIRASAVELCAESLLDSEQRELAHLYSALLSNLTRVPSGVDALVGKGKGTAAANASALTLLKLVASIDRIADTQLLWLSNACVTQEGRAALLLRGQADKTGTTDRQPLSWLLRLLSYKNYGTRLSAASAMRNCAMADDCHDVLVTRTNALGVCLRSMIGPRSRLTPADVASAPDEVREVIGDPTKRDVEQMVEIRLLIAESLLLLCKSDVGLTALKKRGAVAILSDRSEYETDAQVTQVLLNVIQRASVEDLGDSDERE